MMDFRCNVVKDTYTFRLKWPEYMVRNNEEKFLPMGVDVQAESMTGAIARLPEGYESYELLAKKIGGS